MNIRRKQNTSLPMLYETPYVQLYGDRTAVVEEAGTLQRYETDAVVIRTKHRTVSFAGRELRVVCLSSGALAVTGEITQVCFEKLT